MATQDNYFNPGKALQCALPSALERLVSVKFGNSLTFVSGQAVAKKTSDGKYYALNTAASDGTQTFAGFTQWPFATDSTGNVFFCFSPTGAGSQWIMPPSNAAQIFTGGIFNPFDLITAAAGAPVAEIDTVTIGGTVAIGDYYSIQAPGVGGVEYQANSSSANTTALQLAEQWNADPALAAVATATNSTNVSTFTAVTAGSPLKLTVGKNTSAGLIVLAITTPASVGSAGEVDTNTFTTAPSTGDVFTATITYPNLTTQAVTFTVGSTQTVAAAVGGLAAAWQASSGSPTGIPTVFAAASNTATAVIFAGNFAGQAMNIVVTTTSGSTTIAKVVTTAATGCNLSDVQTGNPGAHVLQPYGYWEIP